MGKFSKQRLAKEKDAPPVGKTINESEKKDTWDNGHWSRYLDIIRQNPPEAGINTGPSSSWERTPVRATWRTLCEPFTQTCRCYYLIYAKMNASKIFKSLIKSM